MSGANTLERVQPTGRVSRPRIRVLARLRSLKVCAVLVAVMATVSGSALMVAVAPAPVAWAGPPGWAASAPVAWAGPPGWAIQATTNPPEPSAAWLASVSCPSATACMAVGYNMAPNGVYLAFAEFWDGTTWKIVPPVQPSGTAVSNLAGVSCTSATACTAVGYYTNGSTGLPLAERWDGTGWTLQSVPVPTGSPNTELQGVSCTSATACAAVGYSTNTTTNSQQDLAEFWNGRNTGWFGHPGWTIQPTRAASSNIDYQLAAVSCSSANDCLAVGTYTQLSTPQLTAPWAEHWNGTAWSATLPDLSTTSSTYNNLLGVSCSSATACTAVGFSEDTSQETFPLAERWNGTSWTLQFPELPSSSAGTVLSGVSCPSATACTAVGMSIPPAPTPQQVTVVESWNGSSWTLPNTPDPMFATQSNLDGVSCPSTAVCTAVGISDSWTPATKGFYPIFPLAERYS